MKRVLLGLGSNKGFQNQTPLELLSCACLELRRILNEPVFSSVYRTKAMYVENQDDFYNMVALGYVDDSLSPFELLKQINEIEAKYGRNREQEIRFGPRPLDIDIELFGDDVIDDPKLQIPHIRIKERAFVLVPALEILTDSADKKIRQEYVEYLSKIDLEDSANKIEKLISAEDFISNREKKMEYEAQTVSSKSGGQETAVITKEKKTQYKIGEFEGPLDLLWKLIHESKINIYDIPIAQITEQYLEYLDYAVQTDLSNLSDFYSWAAKLIYIKSRMLLPIEFSSDDDEDEDPRQELVDRLIEYQKFKKLSSLMDEQEDDSEWNFERKKIQRVLPFDEADDMWEEVDTWDLLQQMQSMFKTMMGQYSNETILNMFEEISVNEKITLMNEYLDNKKECMFTDLLTRPGNAMDVICAFMAILEAVKFRMITIFQNKLFGDIKICVREDSDGYVPSEDELTSN